MDGLAIVTGIGLTSFLLFYMAFNIDKEHAFLKLLTIFAGVFVLVFIPQVTIDLDKDCAVLNDGSYQCYYSNGTAVTDYGTRNVGTNFLSSYMLYLWIFVAYVAVYYGYYVLKWAIKQVPARRYGG